MKAPKETTLNQTILNECREEVAKEYGYDNWEDYFEYQFTNKKTATVTIALNKASELALDRLSEFFRWASMAKFTYTGDEWVNVTPQYSKDRLCIVTELELYNIWREGK